MEKRNEIYLFESSKFLLRSLKIILILFFICFGYNLNAQWLSDFDYRKPIEINHSAVNGTLPLADYPMMVSFTDPNLAHTSSGGYVENMNGYDVDFTLSDGTTTLDFEIEKYNPSTGEFVGWVRVPSLSTSTNTMLYMYYGNSNISSNPSTTNTWNSDYIAVWHMGDNYQDATVNDNDATPHGTSNIDGEIGDGDSFDGYNDYIQTSSNELKTEENFTISAWFRTDNTSFSHHLLWEGATGNGYGNGTPSNHPEMNLSFGNIPSSGGQRNNVLVFHLGNTDLEISDDVINIETPFSDKTNWANVVVTVSDMSVNPSAEMFLNGISVGSDNGTLYRTNRSGWNKDLRIGRSSPSERYFDGEMDEIRIMNSVVSDDMISTTFNNTSDPPSFFNTNAAPLDISLSGYIMDENQAAGSVVGTLTTSDPDISDMHTYSLVSGSGNDDNSAFFISGNELRTSVIFNYETKSSYSIRVKTTDNGLDNLSYEKIITITVNDLNEQPVYSSAPDTTATEDEVYTYTINTTDDDGDPVTIDANTLPSWLTLTDNGDGTATLGGTPTNDNVGSNEVELVVSDGSSSTVQNFSIEVDNVNDVATFESVPVTSATEDEEYVYLISTTDNDGNPVTISADNLPSWLTLIDNGDGTATLSGTPTNSEVGNHTIEIEVNDGTSGNIQIFDLTVENVNDTAEFISAPVTTAMQDELYTYIIETGDEDGDQVTISADPIPSWLTLTDNGDGTATLTGTPTGDEVGIHDIVIFIDDGNVITQQDFIITVQGSSSAPEAKGIILTIDEDEQLAYNLMENISDKDTDISELTVSTLTETLNGEISINPVGELIYKPLKNFYGEDSFTYIVCDNEGLCDTAGVKIIVQPVNDAPVLRNVEITVPVDQTVTECLSVDDVENDNVYISNAFASSQEGDVEYESNSLCFDYTPSPTFLGEETIEVTICDDGKPSMCKTFNIKVQIDHNLVIHEGISPNGDGLNDQWIIEGIEYYPENTVKIFNRSGMKIYEVSGYDNAYKVWNGTMNKGIHIGNVAPDGTYYYFIYQNQDKKTKPIRGYIVIN